MRARVSLYELRGDYQLQRKPCGTAPAWETCSKPFLRLKQKLESEGLFLPERKRVPVAQPRAIGVVTSLRGGRTARRPVGFGAARPTRPGHPHPAPVQGADAAPRLIAAIAAANRRAEVDTLLLVRGGGSIEDLWSFNDEGLARAVAASAIPVISGVGHETDFTIVDFVSDLRSPTPTAAAELACVPRLELYNRVMQLAGFLVRAQERRLERPGPAPGPGHRPADLSWAAPGAPARASGDIAASAGQRLGRPARAPSRPHRPAGGQGPAPRTRPGSGCRPTAGSPAALAAGAGACWNTAAPGWSRCPRSCALSIRSTCWRAVMRWSATIAATWCAMRRRWRRAG